MYYLYAVVLVYSHCLKLGHVSVTKDLAWRAKEICDFAGRELSDEVLRYAHNRYQRLATSMSSLTLTDTSNSQSIYDGTIWLCLLLQSPLHNSCSWASLADIFEVPQRFGGAARGYCRNCPQNSTASPEEMCSFQVPLSSSSSNVRS